MNQPIIDTDAVLADLAVLRGFGRDRTGVSRPAFSEPDMAARRWLAEQMRAIGLADTIDGVGNVIGRDPDAGRALLLGSHTDSVPAGGWLDGALGVIYALHTVRAWRANGHAAGPGVDVVSFADEEGTYLGCLGSRAFCGDLGAEEIERAARGAVALRQAFAEAGLSGLPEAQVDPARHIAYLEAHIEQGPRLEAASVDIGVVEGIVGMRRQRIRFSGRADHAGTTPMAMRADAAAALFAFANHVRAAFAQQATAGTVWNIGIVRVAPGAANVVPAEAEMVLEYRDMEAARLERMTAIVHGLVTAADGAAGVAVSVTPAGGLQPAPMDSRLVARVEQAARRFGASSMRLASGAGHDAMMLAAHVPAGMLFVPSIGGRSHDVTEDTAEHDIRRGAEVFAATAFAVLADGHA
ncbi:MAG TPA: hydantoinase/carbamoylase family amidase [Acetobacteraceae bacterium]|nr:hydantoinase/carbamoylase family amidase [Acetobacteraceae bacterium]